MTKRRILFISFILAALPLTGCGSFLEVTPEQHAQIVEYSAGLLLKYDRFYENKLVPIVLSVPEPEEITEELNVSEEEPDAVDETDNRPEIVENNGNLNLSLTEIVGISGLNVQYAKTIVSNRYPGELVAGEVYFGIDATPGNNLVVVLFDVMNTTDSDIYLDMDEYNFRIGIGYNEEPFSISLATLLLEDFSVFQGVIPAGETIELFSMREASVADISEIQKIEYFVRTDDGDFTFVYDIF